MKNKPIVFLGTAAFIAGLALLPSSASAQGSTWAGASLAQMVEGARWHIGALKVNVALSLANAGHDSDVYYGYLGLDPVPDWTFAASVPIQALLPLGKTAVLELVDEPQYLFFLGTERERAWNNIFRGRLHFALEKIYIQAGGGLSNVRRRLSPEFDINVREKADTLDGTLLWQASRKVSLAALYGFARYDYGEAVEGGFDLAGTLNRDESFVDLVTYIEPSTKVRLFVDGQYGRYVFTGPEAADRDARSYGIYGGLAFVPREGEIRPIAPPQGSISLGYKRIDVLEAAFSDGSGPVGAVDVSVGIFKRTIARAFLSRDFAFSVFAAGTFYISTSLGGGISRQLSRRAALSYDISVGRSNYAEAAGPAEDRNFRYTNHMVGLSIRIARYLIATFQASLGSRTMGEVEGIRRRNFFGLSLVYGVPSSSISAPMRGLSR